MDENTKTIPELFGCMVFNEDKMRQRLSADAYEAWRQCMTQGTTLQRSIADQIAAAMKDWADDQLHIIKSGKTMQIHISLLRSDSSAPRRGRPRAAAHRRPADSWRGSARGCG